MRAPRAVGLSLVLFVAGCDVLSSSDAESPDASDASQDGGLACSALADGVADRAAFAALPGWYERVLRAGRPDARGLIGGNATAGTLLDPRVQSAAALLARGAVVTMRALDALDALRAIEVTLARVDAASGRLPLEPGAASPQGTAASDEERDDATLSFLGEACMALEALVRPPADASIATRIEPLRLRAGLAVDAYRFRSEVIALRDRQDAERLWSSARFFAACGRFAGRDVRSLTARFVRDARALERPDGAIGFTVARRADVLFQARALIAAFDVATLSDDATCGDTVGFIRAGSAWLAQQVTSSGSVLLGERARACRAETRLGVAVELEPDVVLRALTFAGATTEQPEVLAAARRVLARVGPYASGYTTCE